MFPFSVVQYGYRSRLASDSICYYLGSCAYIHLILFPMPFLPYNQLHWCVAAGVTQEAVHIDPISIQYPISAKHFTLGADLGRQPVTVDGHISGGVHEDYLGDNLKVTISSSPHILSLVQSPSTSHHRRHWHHRRHPYTSCL